MALPTTPPANRPPPLVDHLGRPIDMSVLGQRIAAPSTSTMRSVYTSTISRDMNPRRLATILQAAESGDALSYLELAEQMEEKDLHYLSVLGTRKRAVAQIDITVEDADETPEAKACGDLLRDWLKRDTLQAELFDILDAVGKGYSMSEIVWETSAREWRPVALEWTDPRFFRLDTVDLRTLQLYIENGEIAPPPPFKFIAHVHPAKSGLPIRGGLARPVAWAWMFKNFTVKDWVAFAEVYGLPIRVGKYGPGATDDERATLLRAVQSIGSDAAAIMPDSMTMEFQEPKSGSANGALFKDAANFFDQQVSKGVLGQTATTDAISGGHAVGREHQLVRDDIKQADTGLLQATLNRDLAQPMVMLNRGPQKTYPRLLIKQPDWVDIQALSSALGQLVPFGLRVGQNELRLKLGVSDPAPGDEILNFGAPAAVDTGQIGQGPGAPAPARPAKPAAITPRADGKHPLKDAVTPASAAPGPHGSAAGARGPSQGFLKPLTRPSGGDVLDDLAATALNDWEPFAEAVSAPLSDLVASATSLEQIRDGLASQIEAMDVTQLAELLARAGFSSRIAGLVGAGLGEGGGG